MINNNKQTIDCCTENNMINNNKQTINYCTENNMINNKTNNKLLY